MTSRARVAAIVLHYEDRELTRRCVESLARALGERDLLIVVDNSWNLEADSLDGIPGSAPVVCRPAERNPGFSRGMNHGGRRAAEANPEWFLFAALRQGWNEGEFRIVEQGRESLLAKLMPF